jgi:Zn-dependent M28 family amino/carboxypeptidase
MSRRRRRFGAFVLVVAVVVFGGCGMLSMPGRSFTGGLPALTDDESRLAQSLRTHVEKLGGEIGERNLWKYDELVASARYIEDALRAMGYDVVAQSYDVSGTKVSNLYAELRGATKPAEIFILGAHYDAVRGCPAANDNGSGVSAVLEMARMFALAPQKPARTIRFVFFVNEEPPFFQTATMGSVVYARACRERKENVVAMWSIETIGYYADARGSQQYPAPFNLFFPDTGNFIAFVGKWSDRKSVHTAIGAFRKNAKFPSEGVAAPEGVQGVGWSDHWAFWQAGYPGLMITDTAPFRYPHYHLPTDTPDKVDYERTARVVMGLTRAARDVAQ